MFSWLTTPLMFGLGLLAVASPIIIHLLNKRRFKIVDWAAMDFLFEADKKNRRRVQIENLILLLLRCLAMLLIGLLLARPFLPSSVARVLQAEQQYERVILIDDSLSARVLNQNRPAIEVTKESIKRLVADLADSDETDDWLTILLTSDPKQPLLANEPISKNTLPSLSETIDSIECSDTVAEYSVALSELRRYVSGSRENIGRVVYLFSDMRAHDWIGSGDLESDSAPNKLLNELSQDTAECFLIDTADENDANLAIVSLRPLGLQVADTELRFSVEVANFGESTVNDVRVLIQVDDSAPQYQMIASIAPGQTEELIFNYWFTGYRDRTPGINSTEQPQPAFNNYRIRAEIDRPSLSDDVLRADQLIEDSSANYAARILDGIPVLLVDGDPMVVSERSETHYLRSVDVLGTGLEMQTVTVSDFEQVSLSEFRVIFLCNVDQASPDRVKSLQQWTRDGGSLVIMPGNKVNAKTFNRLFYDDGRGLSPVALESIGGDPTMSSWVNFEVDQQIHPALRIILASDETSLSKVDIFSWWKTRLDDDQIGKSVIVPLRLSDADNSAAIVERRVGKGTVVAFAVPADGDWTNWPSSATFAPVIVDLIDYLVGSVGQNTNVDIGGQISYPVDLSIYSNRVSLRDAGGDKIEAVARPIDDTAESKENVLYRVSFDEIKHSGFYELGLKRTTGETDKVLFASNIDAREGRLKRMTESDLSGDFFGDRIQRVSPNELEQQEVQGGNTEIWPTILILLLLVLGTEQFLGWWFGRNR